MPCDITFWGRPENEEEVLQRMRRHGYILRTFREPISQKSGAYGPNNIRPVMGIGRPPSVKISYDKVTIYWVVDQVSWVKMSGYWPSSFYYCILTISNVLKVHKHIQEKLMSPISFLLRLNKLDQWN